MERVRVQLRQVIVAPDGTTLEPLDTIEVSIDCYVCERRYRTIVLGWQERDSYCTPTRHRFPGRIESFTSAAEPGGHASMTYDLSFDYQPFIDSKYPMRGASDPLPDWARLTFVATCSACGNRSREDSQSNLVRPFDKRCSRCGAPLYQDIEAPTAERIDH